MKPYTLTLFSLDKPDTPEGIRASVHMIAYGLWEAFKGLPHVTLQYHNTGTDRPLPKTDFAIIHEYYDRPIYSRLPEIRQQTRHSIMGIMESVYDSTLIDHSFSFLPTDRPNAEQIRLPCLGDLLKRYTVSNHYAGSILLDHGWIEQGRRTDISDKLYEWLGPDRPVAQLVRPGHDVDNRPYWVSTIEESNYPAYLIATSKFQTFILTHPGSYEHSIIDMAARGIRVLVPSIGGRPFCHPSLIDDLRLETFSSKDELELLLRFARSTDTAFSQCTDMPQVVGRIDAYCRGVLSGVAE